MFAFSWGFARFLEILRITVVGATSVREEKTLEFQVSKMGFKGRLSAIVVVGGIFFLYVLSIQATALTKLEIGFNEGKTIRKAHDDAPANLLWVVQMSDIHISKWTPERGKALRKSLGHALKLIKPSLVWVTGDLTGTNFLPPSPFSFSLKLV